MSEPAASRQSDAQEPSMEDILASIRRILAEDPAPGEEDAAPAPKGRAAPVEEPEDEELPPPVPPVRLAPVDEPEEDAQQQPLISEQWDEEPEEAVAEPPVPPAPPSPARRAAAPAPRPRPEPEDDLFEDDMAPLPEGDDVFLLQPTMRASGHALVSDEPAADSTDVLSQLARAILNRRDIAVSARSVTLEDMVREMLRPLLHEWLDRNLPYLIERLVKKEIDLMINRAERLED